jgi:urease accessory protein
MLKVIENIGHQHIEADEIVYLPYETRVKARFQVNSKTGQSIGFFLTRGRVIQHKDVCKTECGKTVRVLADQEALTHASIDDWPTLAKGCYHMGNRHVPLQVGDLFMRFQEDQVLEKMLEGFGMKIESVREIFSPENGAYSVPHNHSHDHE